MKAARICCYLPAVKSSAACSGVDHARQQTGLSRTGCNPHLGFSASGHPLELCGDIAWDTYCPVVRLHQFIGEQVVVCGLVIEKRTHHHQVTGEPTKFMTLCDWTGMVKTGLAVGFAENARIRRPYFICRALSFPLHSSGK
jgi:hypothetical protein